MLALLWLLCTTGCSRTNQRIAAVQATTLHAA